MRTCLRFHPATRAVLLGVVLAAFANIFAGASYAQTSPAMPKPWTDAVGQLADKIAANLSPSGVNVEMKNISSLEASYASSVELALESELRRHSFQVGPAGSPAGGPAQPTQLKLTLAESADDYVWVVEMPKKDSREIWAPAMIVSVPKIEVSDGSGGPSLALATRLVWKQAGRFLDFAPSKDSGEPRLVVLESSQIAVYKFFDSHWQLLVTTPVPQNVISSRDPQGTIDFKDGYASVGGFRCIGGPNFTENVHCGPAEPAPLPVATADISGHLKSVGTTVSGVCGDETISFYTGEGDWTGADSIQGYLTKSSASPMVPSGSAIQFDGPVMDMKSDPDANAARAIVHNLKSDNYEAYVVTATCGH